MGAKKFKGGAAAQRERIGAMGGFNGWRLLPEKLFSPRSDPSHDEHASWAERTDPNNPKTAGLIAAMREHGTDEGEPVIVFTDGGTTTIADGDRRQFACAFVNRERAAAKPKLEPLTLRAVTTRDPILARSLGNANRMDDPPMVEARRFRSSASAMGDAPAAAALGLTLAYARALRKCLSLSAEVQAKVNARELPADVAARMVGAGSEKATEAVRKSTGEDGKVDPVRAKTAAREAVPTRPKVRRGETLAGLEAELLASLPHDRAAPGTIYDAEIVREAFAAGLAYARGLDAPSWCKGFVESATQKRRAPANGARMTKGGAS